MAFDLYAKLQFFSVHVYLGLIFNSYLCTFLDLEELGIFFSAFQYCQLLFCIDVLEATVVIFT